MKFQNLLLEYLHNPEFSMDSISVTNRQTGVSLSIDLERRMYSMFDEKNGIIYAATPLYGDGMELRQVLDSMLGSVSH